MTDSSNEHREVPEPSPQPWKVHSTGSYLAIKDAAGGVVIRKIVSGLSLVEFLRLRADFDLIVNKVNHKKMP